MATKERIEAIRVCLKTADSMGGVAPGASWRERTRLLLVALDDDGKRIANLRGLCDALESRAESAESKLAKASELASSWLDTPGHAQAISEQLLAILDGKVTP